uniref:Uncharacterized protein n=1 Tax=Megaselia scalaris TaxID=36166 RepID=T1H5D4_MEGSC
MCLRIAAPFQLFCMSDSPPKFENSSLLVSVREDHEPSAPPYYYQPAPTAPPLQHSISVQPSTSSNPTLNRNISERIVALQKQVVVPKPVVVQNQAVIQKQFVGSKPKIDIESKPLPPIPVASNNNNRQVYEDDENIYEELEPRPEYDDEYFSDSDFDSTDYEDDIDSASESTKNATKEEFKRQYESNSFQDDPLRNLQKVLLTGKQASSSQNNVIKREVPQMSPVQQNISKRGEPERTSDIEN